MISFLLNDAPVHIDDVSAETTVLQLLRDHLHLNGTKEGCASGDCGACTVVVGEPCDNNSKIQYQTVNSCIAPLSHLQGKQLITIEHLKDNDELHPVQQAMVDNHASQCGFCTPGFVMSMFALYRSKPAETKRQQAIDAMAGNLCRCTGYRPIIDACIEACSKVTPDKFDRSEQQTLQMLTSLSSGVQNDKLMQPSSIEQLKTMIREYPEATLIAGGTDLMLDVTQHYQQFSKLISLHGVSELKQVSKKKEGIVVGAGVTLSELEDVFADTHPPLVKLLKRFASEQIRNVATIGGNLANASPIGDLAPALLALRASLQINGTNGTRTVPLREFFTQYRQTVLQSGEWIESVFVPYVNAQQHFNVYKVSKRIEDDISAVCGAFMVTLENDIVIDVSTGFGGVAATPAQARDLEDTLVGQPFSHKRTLELGLISLSEAFSPISDVRASSEYRQHVIQSLWQRFWFEHCEPGLKIQVTEHA